MTTNLFRLRDHEPPMGDLGAQSTLGFTRALWTTPTVEEKTAPENRIIHAKALQLHESTQLQRLGVRQAPGYHKCGSQEALDWVTAFRIRTWTGKTWRTRRYERNLTPPDSAPLWFDLDGIQTSAVLVEVRRSGIDGWWTPWNLAEEAFVLEGKHVPPAPRKESLLSQKAVSVSSLPTGLQASVREGTVRFRSEHLDVGFFLNRTGFSHLCVDGQGQGAFRENLLHDEPSTFHQGVHLHPVGSAPVAAPSLRYDIDGTTCVSDNQVSYTVRLGSTGQKYRLEWTVQPDRLTLRAERQSDTALRAWTSSAWLTGLQSTVSPAHVLGRIQRRGETGWVDLPSWLHTPTFGSFRLRSPDKQGASLRTNVYRAQDLLTTEVKLGEQPQSEGDYLLPAGRFETRLDWIVDAPDLPLQNATPSPVREAVEQCSLTALTYRPDTATLSNNGASIHCPHSLDHWAATTTRLGEILPNIDATYFLQTSLERWLNGGPGYASGPLLKKDGDLHLAEDEYLMTGAAGLLGLSRFLHHRGTPEWVEQYSGKIQKRLDQLRGRDLDEDGLIESPYRTGVSGTGQWSTCWMDVISFGWKDAFANALLYPALTLLADTLPRLEAPSLAHGLNDWASQLRKNYQSTFLNAETGWIAGWCCKEGDLHDYAFLPVNGAAVCGGVLEEDIARQSIERLWNEAQRVGLPDPLLGLPCSLWHIPDHDLADIMQGYPQGYYQNGGRTHSQAHHFVNALYQVGMNEEADQILERLCLGLAKNHTIGGSKSGVDWRYWDGRPCGYEGLLTEQFGLLATAIDRYGSTK